ncbi:DegV family protein [Xanthomonas cucurbitae]|uniref:Uncharacterized protein n=1 Tax=Xanthomonas cucurbitae TaxID=56453 RepID=A0A2S7DVP6_9XANT|nr:hypothetical protein XcuCFBP2542_04320 [Xanthomonas cucurbitae]QHG89180.1 hypothetical protein EBN15_15725 [Xanthomonas cucurbitae]WDM77423.1 DegV family protein [Xanthomonas cucurbitae]WDM79809.1 DegV family protein [Xanthomonas cucurbitae]WDM83503.1 DegV family protein [Xanthomonas cucurbitae]
MRCSALDIKPVLRAYRGSTAPVAKRKGFEPSAEKLFGFTVRKIREGLMTPTVCVGYGGELAELRRLPGYAALQAACQSHDVELLESVMSLTGMVNVGKGALAVGFAAAPHGFAA